MQVCGSFATMFNFIHFTQTNTPSQQQHIISNKGKRVWKYGCDSKFHARGIIINYIPVSILVPRFLLLVIIPDPWHNNEFEDTIPVAMQKQQYLLRNIVNYIQTQWKGVSYWMYLFLSVPFIVSTMTSQ